MVSCNLISHFFTLWFTGFCIVVSLSGGQGKQQMLTDKQPDKATQLIYYNDAGDESYAYRGDRMKRAAIRAAKGLAAFEAILTGAKKVPSLSKYYRLYEKNGGINTALNDFNSIDPVLTAQKQRYGWKPHVLLVGDWRFTLKPHGDRYSMRSPVLEIRSTDVLYYRIVYKVEK